jgi:hypothetical protein
LSNEQNNSSRQKVPKENTDSPSTVQHLDTVDQGTEAFIQWLNSENKQSINNLLILKEYVNNKRTILYDNTLGIRDKFDINFREEGFTRALCEYIDSYSDIAKTTYAGQIYQYTSNFTSLWNNKFIEPIRDTILRTPSHKIYSENKYSLFHYDIRKVLDRYRKLSII